MITVCDSAACEPCPVWFGNSLKVHWGLTDPSSLKGSNEDIANGFRHTINILKTRIEKLMDVDMNDSDKIIDIFMQLGNE